MNVGQYFAQHSALSSGTALAHLLALQTGTGSGQTVFASMFSVQIEEPHLALVQRTRKKVSESNDQSPRQIYERNDKYVFVQTGMARMNVQTLPECLTVITKREGAVYVERDVQSAVVRKCDVLEMP